MLAFAPGHLELRNLRLAGGTGVHAIGPRRVVILSGCEIETETIGIRADTGAAVGAADSVISGGTYGTRITDSVVVIDDSVIHDNDFAARVFGGQLFLNRTDVLDNKNVGVSLFDRSDATIFEGRFANNGFAHLRVGSASRLTLYNTELGGALDTTVRALSVREGGSAGLFHDGSMGEAWGSVLGTGDSFISIFGTTLHGTIGLREFSRLVLEGTVTDGSIVCESAADAWCGTTASALSNSCAGIPSNNCVPDQDAADDVPEVLPFPDPVGVPSLRERLSGDASTDLLPPSARRLPTPARRR